MAEPPIWLDDRDGTPNATVPQPLAAFLADPAATAVLLLPDDDAAALTPHLPRLALIALAFPTFRDGRGYSSAQRLREGGYAGELRAVGDVLVDQIAYLRRCGIDSIAPDAPIDPAVLRRSLDRYRYVYQRAADGATPVWARRTVAP